MNGYRDVPPPKNIVRNMQRLPVLLAVMALQAMLAGCSGEFRGEPVALVDGKAITQLQLGEELGHAGELANDDKTRAKVLQELVDRELLRAEAVRSKIDRDPHVAAALENARTQILAQAYLQSRVAFARTPSREDIRTYFDKHPEKFASRKIFHLKELTLAPADITAELKSVMDEAKTLDDMSAWLDGRRIGYVKATRTLSTSDLPETLVEKMRGVQVGRVFLMNEGHKVSLLAITDIQESPLSLEAAAPQIERLLLNQQGKRLGESELGRLRASARVEYTGKDASRLAGVARPAAPSVSEKIVKVSGSQPGAAQ